MKPARPFQTVDRFRSYLEGLWTGAWGVAGIGAVTLNYSTILGLCLLVAILVVPPVLVVCFKARDLLALLREPSQ